MLVRVNQPLKCLAKIVHEHPEISILFILTGGQSSTAEHGKGESFVSATFLCVTLSLLSGGEIGSDFGLFWAMRNHTVLDRAHSLSVSTFCSRCRCKNKDKHQKNYIPY